MLLYTYVLARAAVLHVDWKGCLTRWPTPQVPGVAHAEIRTGLPIVQARARSLEI